MFQLRRRGQVVYEDLLREMEEIERHLLSEDSTLAMNLMVLEAKIRERFQRMDLQLQEKFPIEEDLLIDDLSPEEARALIPQDLPLMPSMEKIRSQRRLKKRLETVGLAALLAMLTALGMFGLASILQLALTWIA